MKINPAMESNLGKGKLCFLENFLCEFQRHRWSASLRGLFQQFMSGRTYSSWCKDSPQPAHSFFYANLIHSKTTYLSKYITWVQDVHNWDSNQYLHSSQIFMLTYMKSIYLSMHNVLFGQLSSSQPNELTHTLKFVFWYLYLHIFVLARSIVRSS